MTSRLRARPRKSTTDRELAEAWHSAVVHRKAVCIVCGSKKRLQGHHVIEQAAIKAWGRELRWTTEQIEAARWDERNGVAVCEGCHDEHTRRHRRIPRSSLPGRVYIFISWLDSFATKPGHQPIRARFDKDYTSL